MRSPVTQYSLVRPRSLEHALGALHESLGKGRLVPLAGGTDVFVYLNAGTPPGTRYLDLHGLRHAPTSAAAAEVGAWQIQNRATIAGNIANASPAGDSLPVLLAHEAIVHVRSVRGAREIRFRDLYTGYRTLAVEPDELIVAVGIPFAPAGAKVAFRKVGTRRAQSISKVVFCGVLARDRGGRVSHARLAWGSVAPITLRALAAEAALAGAAPSATAAAAAREALGRDLAPIDDIRSTREYRLAVASNVLAQFLRGAHRDYAGG